MILKDEDKILILCKCHKKINSFYYDSDVSFWLDKRLDELRKDGFFVFINSISQEDNEVAMIPCYNVKECPMKKGFNLKPGKIQLGVDDSSSCNCS